jgi:hypothetical protein
MRAISEQQFRAHMRRVFVKAQSGGASIVEALADDGGNFDLTIMSAVDAAVKLEEAALMMRRAIALAEKRDDDIIPIGNAKS